MAPFDAKINIYYLVYDVKLPFFTRRRCERRLCRNHFFILTGNCFLITTKRTSHWRASNIPFADARRINPALTFLLRTRLRQFFVPIFVLVLWPVVLASNGDKYKKLDNLQRTKVCSLKPWLSACQKWEARAFDLTGGCAVAGSDHVTEVTTWQKHGGRYFTANLFEEGKKQVFWISVPETGTSFRK